MVRIPSGSVDTFGTSAPATKVILVAFPAQSDPQKPPNGDSTAPPDQPAADDEEQESETPALRGYTAPSAEIRNAVLLAIALATRDSMPELVGGGKELAESMLSPGTSVVGQPGLAAPQPSISTAVVTRPGLQEGPATGIGFASPFNILTPQVNLLSGPMGRCTDLAIAGFFGRSVSTCELSFRRR